MGFNDLAKKIFNPAFYFIILALFLVELLSYLGYIFLDIDHWLFWLLIVLTLFLSIKKIEYGVWVVLLELFVGSKGYLAHFDFAGNVVSLRISLWVVLLSVFTQKLIFSLSKKNKRSVLLAKETWQAANLKYFLILFFFLAAGAVRGLAKNDFQNFFFDFNGWLYFALLFPLLETFLPDRDTLAIRLTALGRIFAASLTWLSFKFIFLLFVFSHTPSESSLWHNFLSDEMYHWVRDTGIGEITAMPSGLVRIFSQSQIFFLAGFYFLFFFLNRFWPEIKSKKKSIAFFFAGLAVVLAVIIISLSRSFWIGLAISFPFASWLAIRSSGWKSFSRATLISLIALIVGAGLAAAVIKFPFPKPGLDFSVADALAARIKKIDTEAAAASRWALLPALKDKIAKNPVFGGGFGSTVTYRTSDPRVLENNSDGLYTTYAFEWGWLDIWLKVGLFGLIAYLALFGKIIIDGLQKRNHLSDALVASLIALAAVSIFSPYTNHPLGIGFLILSAILIHLLKTPFSCACLAVENSKKP